MELVECAHDRLIDKRHVADSMELACISSSRLRDWTTCGRIQASEVRPLLRSFTTDAMQLNDADHNPSSAAAVERW